MKLAIVGSRDFNNEEKVKRLLEKYIERYGIEELIVVSGGCPTGADALAKKIAILMNIKYVEFPPKHVKHNIYCVMPESDYNKPYHVSNFFARNTQIAEFCEHMFAFTVKGKPCKGTWDSVNKAKKFNKPVVVIED